LINNGSRLWRELMSKRMSFNAAPMIFSSALLVHFKKVLRFARRSSRNILRTKEIFSQDFTSAQTLIFSKFSQLVLIQMLFKMISRNFSMLLIESISMKLIEDKLMISFSLWEIIRKLSFFKKVYKPKEQLRTGFASLKNRCNSQ
jgi:hypothetical protein